MKTKNQDIDRLIQGIKTITKNRFSLLDEDVQLLNEIIEQLEELKRRKHQDNHTTLLIALKIVMMAAKVFFSHGQD